MDADGSSGWVIDGSAKMRQDFRSTAGKSCHLARKIE
jgi:hypothetical protein